MASSTEQEGRATDKDTSDLTFKGTTLATVPRTDTKAKKGENNGRLIRDYGINLVGNDGRLHQEGAVRE